MATSEAETYGLELADIGPVMDVAPDRGGGARFTLEVGYWGISLRLDPSSLVRLREQIDKILGG